MQYDMNVYRRDGEIASPSYLTFMKAKASVYAINSYMWKQNIRHILLMLFGKVINWNNASY